MPLEEYLEAIRRTHRFHWDLRVSHCNGTLENRAVAAPFEDFLAVQRRSLLPGSQRGRGAVAVTRAVVSGQRRLIRKPAAMTGTCREAVTRAVVSRQRRLFWQPAAVIGACRETIADAARRCLTCARTGSRRPYSGGFLRAPEQAPGRRWDRLRPRGA